MSRLLYPLIPPPSQHRMQGPHASFTSRAHVLPAFSLSLVSSRRGALGALDDVLVRESSTPNDAVLSSMAAVDRERKSHGRAGMASTLPTPLLASLALSPLLCVCLCSMIRWASREKDGITVVYRSDERVELVYSSSERSSRRQKRKEKGREARW